MNPQITLPRPHSYTNPNPYAAVAPAHRSSSFGAGDGSSGSVRVPRLFRRLLKFPQMDFEMAVWEMTSLLVAPKKVFRNVYYHQVRVLTGLETYDTALPPSSFTLVPPVAKRMRGVTRTSQLSKQSALAETKHTWANSDPAFPYLLSFFLLLTSLAWSVAYARASALNYLRVALVFVLGHCLLSSLLVATAMYFLVGRLLGPGGGIKGFPGRRRRGLFERELGAASGESLEFGYCFDVAIRAFFPLWVFLYVVQFLLMPLIAGDHWPSLFLSNTIYLVAFTYYSVITFLGYNALPFLHHTELLLAPTALFGLVWLISLFGFNFAKHFAPIMLSTAALRGPSTPQVPKVP